MAGTLIVFKMQSGRDCNPPPPPLPQRMAWYSTSYGEAETVGHTTKPRV